MSRAPGKYYNRPANRPQSDRTITGTKILLVEGPDDIYFFDALLRTMSAPIEDIQVIDYEGKDKLQSTLSILYKMPEVVSGAVRAVGLVQDADGNVASAKHNIDSAWRAVGLSPAPYGRFIATQEGIHAGSFALPDCQSEGDLDEMLFATASAFPAQFLASKYLEEVGLLPAPRFYKRATQVYLAAQTKLSRGAGRGADNGYFDLDHEGLNPVRGFIQSLIDV